MIKMVACDQCRKTKSKCESGGGDSKQCKSCSSAGVGQFLVRPPESNRKLIISTSVHIFRCSLISISPINDFRALSFRLGPSYKRGPPKGYIHAIEQRWHQVEALIGAILQCPDERVQTLVSDLKQDDLAREILSRVDSGPYVRLLLV